MSKNSLEEAHANISNVIYQAILNPHFNKETIVQVCDASKQNGFAGLCTNRQSHFVWMHHKFEQAFLYRNADLRLLDKSH